MSKFQEMYEKTMKKGKIAKNTIKTPVMEKPKMMKAKRLNEGTANLDHCGDVVFENDDVKVIHITNEDCASDIDRELGIDNADSFVGGYINIYKKHDYYWGPYMAIDNITLTKMDKQGFYTIGQDGGQVRTDWALKQYYK